MKELRDEIKRILDRYPEDQVADVLRLVELTILYTRMLKGA